MLSQTFSNKLDGLSKLFLAEKQEKFVWDWFIVCVFFYYLQEEFTTLEEKASNVLQDYEKAQVVIWN